MEVIPVDISNTTSPQIEFDYFCYNTTNPVPANIFYSLRQMTEPTGLQ